MSHTPETLHVGGETFAGEISIESTMQRIAKAYLLDDATRIVACWNGCMGIDPAAVPELVRACEAFAAWARSDRQFLDDLRRVRDATDTAITRAKGGAK